MTKWFLKGERKQILLAITQQTAWLSQTEPCATWKDNNTTSLLLALPMDPFKKYTQMGLKMCTCWGILITQKKNVNGFVFVVYSNCYYLRQTNSNTSFIINSMWMLWFQERQEFASNVLEFLLTACKCTTNDSSSLWVQSVYRDPPWFLINSARQALILAATATNKLCSSVYRLFLSIRWTCGGRRVTLHMILARLLE